MKIIITDLTKFGNEDLVCIAGISLDTGKCVRPLPYLKSNICKKYNILPGGILSGTFSKATQCSPPHTENMNYSNLKFHGQSSSKEFENILSQKISSSVEEGFKIFLDDRQKHIPIETPPELSIITLSINPYQIDITENTYKQGKILFNFTDSSGKNFRYMPITDLRYNSYANKNVLELDASLSRLNNFINSQRTVYIRIGLTRPYSSQDGRNGYWIQVNGIYTFPDFFKNLRFYN